jgi:3-hydroxyacyl-CoA dehydrogenase
VRNKGNDNACNGRGGKGARCRSSRVFEDDVRVARDGKVATSAQEARAWGFLRESDTISMNGDRLIADAKQEVLNLVASGFVAPVPREDIFVLGESAQAAMKLALHMMKRGGFISDHDETIGKKLANVMSGGNMNHNGIRQ